MLSKETISQQLRTDEVLMEGKNREFLINWLKKQILQYPLLALAEGQFSESFLNIPEESILTFSQYGRDKLTDGEMFRDWVMGEVAMYSLGEGGKAKRRSLYIDCANGWKIKEWQVTQEGYIGTKLVSIHSFRERGTQNAMWPKTITVFSKDPKVRFDPDDLIINVFTNPNGVIDWQIGKQVAHGVEYETPTPSEKKLVSITREGDEVVIGIKGIWKKELIDLSLRFPGESIFV